ncbi:MAG: hypothetical protein IPN69_00010 [Acidobacteria bacterium]|nr:hypothetical protein [Acidobacteriota bacterium]
MPRRSNRRFNLDVLRERAEANSQRHRTADSIVRHAKNLPFRIAHKIVGEYVKTAYTDPKDHLRAAPDDRAGGRRSPSLLSPKKNLNEL